MAHVAAMFFLFGLSTVTFSRTLTELPSPDRKDLGKLNIDKFYSYLDNIIKLVEEMKAFDQRKVSTSSPTTEPPSIILEPKAPIFTLKPVVSTTTPEPEILITTEVNVLDTTKEPEVPTTALIPEISSLKTLPSTTSKPEILTTTLMSEILIGSTLPTTRKRESAPTTEQPEMTSEDEERSAEQDIDVMFMNIINTLAKMLEDMKTKTIS